MLDGEGTDDQEMNMRFGLSTKKSFVRGLKIIWELKMVKPSSARIIQDVDLALKSLGLVYCTNGDAIEGLDDRNVHR